MSIKIHIRRAEHSDIDELVAVCRECFPDSLKHNAFDRIARKRWTHIVKSACIETYVAEVAGKVAGFYVLKTDMSGYRREKEQMSVFDRLTIALGPISGGLKKPGLLWNKMRDLIKRKASGTKTAYEIGRNIPKESSIDKVAWGDIRATSPSFQKMGVARELNRFVINRCRELNKEILGGNVEENNFAVRTFIESLGYVATGKVRNRIIYKKQL